MRPAPQRLEVAAAPNAQHQIFMFRQRSINDSAITIFLALVVALSLNDKADAIESTLTFGPSTPQPANWYTDSLWSNGVPNAPGDIANLLSPVVLRSFPTTRLDSSAVLGELNVSGVTPQTIAGVGALAFDTGGVRPGRISTTNLNPDAAVFGAALRIEPRVLSFPGKELHLSAGVNAPITLTSSITADSKVTFSGDVRLLADSRDLTGVVDLMNAYLTVSTARGLGDPTAPTRVDANSTVALQANSAERFELHGGIILVTNAGLTGAIRLDADSRISVSTTSVRDISGVVSGPGGLTLRAPTSTTPLLRVTGANTYDGVTTIDGGFVVATNPNSFGSIIGGTSIRGADVLLQASTNESFRVEAGSLRIDSAAFLSLTPVTLAGGKVVFPTASLIQTPIKLDGSGGIAQFAFNEAASWTGGSSGTGHLQLSGRIRVDAPLTHDGDLLIDGVVLNTANTYTGKTTIRGGYTIDRADAFGVATSPIVIENGGVTVRVLPNGDRGFVVKRDILNVQTSQPINAPIVLGGVYEASLRGIGTFNGPIDYITTPGGGYASIQGGTFNGAIRGDTTLRLGGAGVVTLNSANEIGGPVLMSEGRVIVNDQDALNLPATVLQGGVLELNVPLQGTPVLKRYPFANEQTGTLKLNIDQEFEGRAIFGEGTVSANAAIGFDRVLTAGALLKSTENGSISIDSNLIALRSGGVSGLLKGQGDLRFTGESFSLTADLANFDGDVIARRGAVALSRVGASVDPFAMSASTELHVYPGASIDFGSSDGVITNNIYLHDTQGISPSDGPLRSRGFATHTLAGVVDVGAQGSTLGDKFSISGTLRGNNLTFSGSALRLVSPQEELAGDLRVRKGFVHIEEAGSISSLDSIRIQSGAGFIISAQGSGAYDRVSDAIEVSSHGGQLWLHNDFFATGSETLGRVHLEGGLTEILAQPTAPLVINQLQRERGSLLRFHAHAGAGAVKFGERPELTYGMLGGWAVTSSGFATLDAGNRFTTLATTSSDLNTAGPNDHVGVQGGATLSSDRVVASVKVSPLGSTQALNLNGHRLTVRSGGVYSSGDIVNGELTAGDGAPAELFLYNTRRVNANIVDNGPDGSVSLVLAGYPYSMTLGGQNTYSGGTWVIGDRTGSNTSRAVLIADGAAAIPANGDVHVDFGEYQARLASPGIVKLDSLHIDNGGLVTGINATLDADAYYFRDGALHVPITGDGAIYKDGDGDFEFAESVRSPNFTGEVRLRDGALALGNSSLPRATIAVEGGRLASNNGLANSILLDGGELTGRFNGAIQVVSPSQLSHVGFTLLYGVLSGDGDLTINGSNDDYYVGVFGQASGYTGDFRVQSGVLRIGAPAALGDGKIYVEEGAQLTLGSDRPSSGPTHVAREMHVTRGTIYVTPPSSIGEPNIPNGVVNGDVYVDDFAYFGASRTGRHNGATTPGLEFGGRVVLGDDATIIGKANDNAAEFIVDVPLVEVTGQLDVGARNVWQLDLASLGVSGVIRANSPVASIDFRGASSLLDLSRSSFITDAGHSLTLTVNGEVQDVSLEYAESRLTGGGSLVGDFSLTNGATVAPGASPGELTIDGDLELGGASVYEWEMEPSLLGPGLGWDFLQVNGTLNLSATPDSPWLLEIAEPVSGLTSNGGEWLIASASTINGFDPASVEIVFGNEGIARYGAIDLSLSVEQRGQDLYLIVGVPEPTAIVLLGVLLTPFGVLQGSRDSTSRLRLAFPVKNSFTDTTSIDAQGVQANIRRT